MMSEIQHEREFTGTLAKEFISEGYQQLDPASVRHELPPGYTPDLIFSRGDEVIVVELKSSTEHRSLENLRSVKNIIERKPNWKYRIYVLPRKEAAQLLQDNLQDIEAFLSRAKQLNRNKEFESASVVLWMAIEVALRTLLTIRQSRPNLGVSGMSMARSLLALGELTEGDLALIDHVWRIRNIAAHGYRLDPREPLSPDLIKLARNLAKKAQSEAIPAS